MLAAVEEEGSKGTRYRKYQGKCSQPKINAKEIHDRIESGESIVILDIREPDEWAKGYIEGAVLLSRGRIEGRVEEMVPDKDACIVAH